MRNSQLHLSGWVSVNVDSKFELRAKDIRADRDQKYKNIYKETNTDERWVGDLGEIVFNSWLKHLKVENFSWILANAAGKPDFIIGSNVSVDVKTVKRQGPPSKDYTAQITARHLKKEVDYYFFMSYDYICQKMWLLGGINRQSFVKSAVYYSAGDSVHKNYIIRPGHEIYNIDIGLLTPPNNWAEQVCKVKIDEESIPDIT